MTEKLKVIVRKWDPGSLRPWGWHCEICNKVRLHRNWHVAYFFGLTHFEIWHGKELRDGQQT